MSNFYVRNMLRGDYSRSSKSVGSGAGSLGSSLNQQINTILPLDSTIEKETKNVMFDTDSTSSRVSLIENKKDAAVEASFLDYRNLPNTNIVSAASATNTTGIEYVSLLPYHEHQVIKMSILYKNELGYIFAIYFRKPNPCKNLYRCMA